MTQPGVYFTLDAPFVEIIGLYSNTSEGATEGVISGGVVGQDQLTFLQNQLSEAVTQRNNNDRRALVIAVHHPPFTGSSQHVPSPRMLDDIDQACRGAGVFPDVVLSGHAHLYERYTRVIGGRQIPYVVSGNGGYFNLSGFKKGRGGLTPRPPVTGNDGKGNSLTLEAFDDAVFGFLRLTAAAAFLSGEFVGVDKATGAVATKDSFKLDLNAHTLI